MGLHWRAWQKVIDVSAEAGENKSGTSGPSPSLARLQDLFRSCLEPVWSTTSWHAGGTTWQRGVANHRPTGSFQDLALSSVVRGHLASMKTLKTSSLGLSESRAQWLVGWCTRLLRDRCALDCDRPFLAPLYAFASRHAPHSVKPLSVYVLVTLEYLKRKILQRRHCPCALQRRSWKEAWRVDVHADENGVGVGGWWPQANEKGVVNKWDSPWFAVRVTPENSPWAFQKKKERLTE